MKITVIPLPDSQPDKPLYVIDIGLDISPDGMAEFRRWWRKEGRALQPTVETTYEIDVPERRKW